jgi:hypothetical protein
VVNYVLILEMPNRDEIIYMPNDTIVLESELVWEVVRGSYGAAYTATIEDEDYSTFTPYLYIWSRKGKLYVDGRACAIAFSTPDTTITYTIVDGDFPDTMAPGNYNGIFKLTRTGAEERSLKFSVVVYDKEVED